VYLLVDPGSPRNFYEALCSVPPPTGWTPLTDNRQLDVSVCR